MKQVFSVTTILVLLFFLSQIMGIAILSEYVDFDATSGTNTTILKNDSYFITPPVIEDESTSFVYILLAILCGTALLLVLIKYGKILLWQIWFFVSVLITLSFALFPFILHVVASRDIALALTFLISVLLAYLKIVRKYMTAHTVSELLMYGGLAALLVPIINLRSALILMILLSVYDVYMVRRSGHMVTLAKAQMQSQLIAGLYVSADKTMKVPSGVPSASGKSTQAMVGGGDIAFPLLFAGAVMKYFGSIWSGWFIAIGATVGLAALFLLGSKNKFYPAMPFITTGCLIALWVVWMFL